jgi:hypothetical protein
LIQADSRNYGRYVDDRNYNRSVLESDRGFNYQQGRDAMGDALNMRDYNRGVMESDRNFDYQKDRDVVIDENNDRNYDRSVLESDRGYNYQVGRDKVTDAADTRNYDRSVLESDRGYNYSVSRDKVMDGQWLKQFNASEQQRIVQNAIEKRQISVSEGNLALSRSRLNYEKEQDRAAAEASNTIGALYGDMMGAQDPSKWLQQNAQWLTSSELKSLAGYLPKNNSTDALIQALLGGDN